MYVGKSGNLYLPTLKSHIHINSTKSKSIFSSWKVIGVQIKGPTVSVGRNGFLAPSPTKTNLMSFYQRSLLLHVRKGHFLLIKLKRARNLTSSFQPKLRLIWKMSRYAKFMKMYTCTFFNYTCTFSTIHWHFHELKDKLCNYTNLSSHSFSQRRISRDKSVWVLYLIKM